MELWAFIIMLAISFCAVMIGTLVGMAMIILPPAMIFLGVPPHIAIATARLSLLGNGIGNMMRFSQKTKIEARYIVPFAVCGIIGSMLGAFWLDEISESTLLNILGWMMMGIAIIVLFEEKIKSLHLHREITAKNHVLSCLGGFLIGSYLGVMGGGAATLIIFLMVVIYGLDFKRALAHQKFIIFPIGVITSIIFISQGMIDYSLAIPLFIVNIAGGWVGAHFLMNVDAKWIKKVMVPITMVLGIVLLIK